MALVLGRPMMVSNFDCDTQLPIDCDIPDRPSRTVPVSLSNSPENGSTSTSASIVRYSISAKVHLMRELRLDRPHPKDYHMVGVLHQQVLAILDNTKPVLRHQNPDTSWDLQFPYLAQQREELVTIVFTFLTALHRPHLSTHVDSRRAVLQAGIVVLDSQQRLFDRTKPHHYTLCHLSFYTVDAAILLSAVIALYPQQIPEDTSNVHRVLQQAVVRLSKMAPVNPTAKSGLDVLRRCYQSHQGPSESSPSASVAPATLSFTGAQLQDIQRPLSPEQLNYQSYMPTESRFSPNLTHDFSTTDEFATTTHYFDESYWLHQVDGIYSAADPASDLDTLMEPH